VAAAPGCKLGAELAQQCAGEGRRGARGLSALRALPQRALQAQVPRAPHAAEAVAPPARSSRARAGQAARLVLLGAHAAWQVALRSVDLEQSHRF